jgi:putative phosphoribosyl transferase
MYFKSRLAAGRQLAQQIAADYGDQPCAVVALSDGGVMVGSQIALELNCVLTMLLAEKIVLPRENEALAGISSDGSFSYNHHYSQGEIEEFVSEYYGVIEQEKLNKMSHMHHLAKRGGLIRKELLEDKHVILVADGIDDGFVLDIAMQYLKPIHHRKLLVATPFASVSAVDRMHVLADGIYCMNVIEDYISTDHYYDTQDVPPHDRVITTVEKIVAHWR